MAKEAKPIDLDGEGTLSVKEVCELEGIHPNTYHRLRGKGPGLVPDSYLSGQQRKTPKPVYRAFREAKLHADREALAREAKLRADRVAAAKQAEQASA